MNERAPRWSTSRGWIVVLVIVLVMFGLSSLTLHDAAENRGWFSSSPIREARVVSAAPGQGDDRIDVTWELPGEHAQGEVTLEHDAREPTPTSTPVFFDSTRQRWIATEGLGHSRWDMRIDVIFLTIEAAAILWCLLMIYVRESDARAPQNAVVDREALAKIAKQKRAPWQWLRAAFALAFYLGLHALAFTILSVAALMLWSTWRSGRIHMGAIGFATVAAYGVGRAYLSLLRPRRSPEPGARISRDEHPAFFAELELVASRCHTRVPDAVFLVDGRNAAVTEEARWFGLRAGERRLVIGTSLVFSATVSELRAVLAHELGHFVGGDARSGQLVYAVRRRTLALIESFHSATHDKFTAAVSLPFEVYFEAFLFVTQGISRTQELLADKLAIAVAGRDACVSILKKTAVSAVVDSDFWKTEVAPLIDGGFIPTDIERGEVEFERRGLSRAERKRVEVLLRAQPADPFDSHPTLMERIAFANEVEAEPVAADDRAALSLFDEAKAVTAVSAIRKRVFEERVGRALEEIRFSEAFERFWLPLYRGQSDKLREVVKGDDGGVRGLEAMTDAANTDAIGEAVDEFYGSEPVTDEKRREVTRAALHARLVAVLATEPGAAVHFELSQPLRITRANGTNITPNEFALRMVDHPSERASMIASLNSDEPS